MLATKIKMTTTVLLAVATMAGLGSGGLVYRMQAAEKRQPDEQQTLRANETQPGDTVFAPENDADDEDRLVGSGKEGRKEIKVADFVSLVVFDQPQINVHIQVSATRGDAFSVIISGDDNLVDLVEVDKVGSALKISVAKRVRQMKQPLKATITMPTLERVQVYSGCQLTIKDFKSNKEFKAELSGASNLEGSIEAGDMKLDAGGASRVKLKGFAKQATISASGACHFQLQEFALETASVKLTGASRAAVNVKTNLDYSLTGASHLHYKGNPKINKARSSGASSASHK